MSEEPSKSRPMKTAQGQYLDRVLYEKERVIFKEGDNSVNAFMIEAGKVGIFKTSDGKKTPLAVMKAGAIFGEMAAITGSARTATAIALEPCTIVRISRQMIDEKIKNADPFLRALINILITNLSQVNERYATATKHSDSMVKALKTELAAVKETASAGPASEDEEPAPIETETISLDEIADGAKSA